MAVRNVNINKKEKKKHTKTNLINRKSSKKSSKSSIFTISAVGDGSEHRGEVLSSLLDISKGSVSNNKIHGSHY